MYPFSIRYIAPKSIDFLYKSVGYLNEFFKFEKYTAINDYYSLSKKLKLFEILLNAE